MLYSAIIGLIILYSSLMHINSVDQSKFRTCSTTKFCSMHRISSSVSSLPKPTIDTTIYIEEQEINTLSKGYITFKLVNNIINTKYYNGRLEFLDNGAVNIRIEEKDNKRWEDTDTIYSNLTLSSSITEINDIESFINDINLQNENKSLKRVYGYRINSHIILAVYTMPFKIEIYNENVKIISINEYGLFHYDERSEVVANNDNMGTCTKPTNKHEDRHHGKKIVDYGEDGLAIYEDGTVEEKQDISNLGEYEDCNPNDKTGSDGPETFGSFTDSKPHGHQSVGIDINFYGEYNTLYGIPEHATSFPLKDTKRKENNKNDAEDNKAAESHYNEPYRLYNLDVFEYDLDVPMAIYGSIPLLISHNSLITSGLFWNNPSETFIDIETFSTSQSTHWISESGVLDIFLLLSNFPLNKSDQIIQHIPKYDDITIDIDSANEISINYNNTANTVYSINNEKSIFRQYAELTGFSILPPMFALGYHQCRWNYKSQSDVEFVNSEFEANNIPYDVLWLDIEHTDGKRYFTWDLNLFPDPVKMQNDLAVYQRKMVTIVDPHIKRDASYYIHKEAESLGYYIKDSTNKDYDGWCWPGSSSYLDFTNSKVRDWWSSQFDYDKYRHSTKNLYTWNDMNEPSVFNGPEVSMPKDCLNIDGTEHRQWHNLYGRYMHKATMEGQIKRQVDTAEIMHEITALLYKTPSQYLDDNHKTEDSYKIIKRRSWISGPEFVDLTTIARPFVLSRSFFSGTQKYGAIWTGDNKATWEHLDISIKMLLSMSICNLVFIGADVGGFFGNPTEELLVRWYQLGVFYPFYRAHAHHDSKRREPYLFNNPTKELIVNAIKERYTLLPYIYTCFYVSYRTGTPILRPLWYEFNKDIYTFKMDNAFMFGKSLLIHPITQPSTTSVQVYLPLDSSDAEYTTLWYDIHSVDYKMYVGGNTYDVPVTMSNIPVYLRGGNILFKKIRVRRSSDLMKDDPYTLLIALDSMHNANGAVYIDDETSLNYLTSQNRTYSYITYKSVNNNGDSIIIPYVTIIGRNKDISQINNDFIEDIGADIIEKINIISVSKAPKQVILTLKQYKNGEKNNVIRKNRELNFVYEEGSKCLTLRNPLVSLQADNWNIYIRY